jgi:hypothetical protein
MTADCGLPIRSGGTGRERDSVAHTNPKEITTMLVRSAIAAATLSVALMSAAPAARADIGMMMAHNYEIVMNGVRKENAARHNQVPVRQVMQSLRQRGYGDFRVLSAPRGVYRILAHRKGRAYVVTAGARSGRILSVNGV